MSKTTPQEPLLFGSMTYPQIMKLRAAYNLGIRDNQTRQANALYHKLLRRGWAARMKQRNGVENHEND
ncbi:hypothetical protein I6L27_19190 [Acinetobacter pittii]|uniref:hypothetical protein n=1 Tax=Acinetobacter pittii TaxID=48296 RepID=UPI001C22606D|nr:hypothetical protein [Acinetobacter pittii]QXA09927.1 hypothetical protein I6L27_19190 [Acinetobacter pittii]